MKFLPLSILTLFTLILYGIHFSFRFYSHFILSMFVHGVSGGKIYFLLIYSAVVFLLLFLQNGKKRKDRSAPMGWTGRLFLLWVILGMGASMGSFVRYVMTYDLPLEVHHYHFREIYNSVNYFPHIHTSKLYLYKIGDLLGFDQALKNMDDGRVFANAVPAFYSYVTLLSTISVLILSFFIISRIVFKWETTNKTGVSILCVLSFYSVIKCISDGGLFAYDFLVAAGALYILMHTKSPGEVNTFFKKRWKILFWATIGILSIQCLIDPSLEIVTYTLKHGLVILSIHSLTYIVFIRNSLTNRRLKGLFLTTLSLFLIYTVYQRYSVYLEPFFSYLEKGTEVHYFHYKDRQIPERLKGSRIKFASDFFNIYCLTIQEKERVLDIYRSLGENPYRNRHIAILFPKKSRAYGLLGEFIPLDFKKEVALKVLNIFDLKLTEKNSKESFLLEMAFDPSYFPVFAHAEGGKINQLDENHKFVIYYFLNRFSYFSGIKEYILIPHGFYRFD